MRFTFTDFRPRFSDSCLVDDTLDLDFIPIPYIGAALSAAKSHLARSQETFDVEFTSLSTATAYMSYEYMLCCAILLPNEHNVSKSKKTALPFFVSFPDIVKRLSAETGSTGDAGMAIVIQSVSDVSLVHAEALEAHENDMIHDKWVRDTFAVKHGLDVWRETRLRLRWEAALLRSKILVRWKVTLFSSLSSLNGNAMQT